MPASTPTSNTQKPKSLWQRAGEWLKSTAQNVVNNISSAVAGTLSPQKTGSYKLITPTKTITATPKTLGGDGPFLISIFVITVVVLLLIDPWRRHGISAKPTCTDTYAACFKNSERLPLRNGQTLDAQQFDEMLDAIHDDLSDNWRTPLDPGRMAYDTPFWNGNPRFGKPIYGDEVVCLNNKCSERSAINYVAQGMYSAHTGQSLDTAKEVVQWWNRLNYFHNATEDELYWLEYGYNAEKERIEDLSEP
jgi:hypothetical protein